MNHVVIGAGSSVGDSAVVHVAGLAGNKPTIVGSNVVIGEIASLGLSFFSFLGLSSYLLQLGPVLFRWGFGGGGDLHVFYNSWPSVGSVISSGVRLLCRNTSSIPQDMKVVLS